MIRYQSPVKSDPYKKGLRKRRMRFLLWPSSFWGRLVDQEKRDWKNTSQADLSSACIRMIAEINSLLYGAG